MAKRNKEGGFINGEREWKKKKKKVNVIMEGAMFTKMEAGKKERNTSIILEQKPKMERAMEDSKKAGM